MYVPGAINVPSSEERTDRQTDGAWSKALSLKSMFIHANGLLGARTPRWRPPLLLFDVLSITYLAPPSLFSLSIIII